MAKYIDLYENICHNGNNLMNRLGGILLTGTNPQRGSYCLYALFSSLGVKELPKNE